METLTTEVSKMVFVTAKTVSIPTLLQVMRRTKTPTEESGSTTKSKESANRVTSMLESTTATGMTEFVMEKEL